MAEPGKSKRSWPRFSLRFVLLAMTLVCVYLSCWSPTEYFGLRDVENYVFWRGERPNNRRIVGINATASLPLVVGMDRNFFVRTGSPLTVSRRCYYLWCFGPVVKLPFERTNPVDASHWSRIVRTEMTQYEITALLGPPDLMDNNAIWKYSDVGTFYFDERGCVSEIRD